MADRFVLDGANQQTSWWVLRDLAEPVSFMLTGDFDQPVSVHYSNNEDYNKGIDYSLDDSTYPSAVGPREIPFAAARFVRFASGGAWTNGTKCTPSFAVSKNATGQLVTPSIQSQRSGAS